MRTDKIEKKLAEEVRGETPDVLARILARCGETPQQAAPVPISAVKGRKWVKAMYAAAAMLLLFVGGYFGIGQYRQAYAAEYTVTLEAGAGVRLEVSKTGRVVSASGLDEKGRAAIEAAQSGGALRGQRLGEALEAVVAALAEGGAVPDRSTVLVSVAGPDAGKNASVKTETAATVEKTLAKKGIRAAVLGQVVAQSEKLRALAEKCGVSAGRAALIEQAAENEPGLTEGELAGLDIGALAALGAGNTGAGVSAADGTETPGGYLSAEAAAGQVRVKAGVAPGGAKTDVSADIADGKLVYRVRLATSTGGVSCEVDAKTGAILRWVADAVAAGGDSGDKTPTVAQENPGAAPSAQTAGDSALSPAPSADTDGTQSVIDKVQNDIEDALDKAKQDLESRLTQK